MSKPPPMKTTAPPPPSGGIPRVPPAPTTPRAAVRAPKTFAVVDASGHGEGEKVVIYGPSGVGKTTLAAMAPDPVFVSPDDGARKIRDPRTGAILKMVGGVRDFDDLRDVMNQHTLFDKGGSMVLDTITKAEEWMEPFIFANYKSDKGATVKTLEGYGWGKGYRHALEVTRLFLQDIEGLMRKGVNVILLAQENAVTMPNPEGLDFLQAGPKMHHTKQYSSRQELCEWADHVLRVGYHENQVVGADGATRGKLATSSTTRVVYTGEARHFFAKSRTLTEPVISFAEAKDDSLWRWMFPNQQ